MKFIRKISLLSNYPELDVALANLVPWATRDDCLDGFELVDGRCKSPCQVTASAGLDAEADCLLPHTTGFWGYFVLLSSALIWVFVILRMSADKPPRRMFKKIISLINNKNVD